MRSLQNSRIARRRRHWRVTATRFGIVIALLLTSRADLASAAKSRRGSPPLSKKEQRRLKEGESVGRRFTIRKGEDRYHAGLSYRIVRGTPMDVVRALRKPGTLAQVLPYGIEARTIAEGEGHSTIRVHQGKPPVTGSYTVRMLWDLSSYRAHFYLDPAHINDIRDMWGSFAAREVSPGYTLISFAFAFDIGGVGSILENKAQRWALDVPERIAEMMSEGP